MKILPARSAALTFAALVVCVHAQVAPIGRYPLNNNANDAVGTNHGTIVGATPTPDRFGQGFSAYQFGGTTRIDFPGPPPFTQTNNWTLSAWIKPATFAQPGVAVYVGADNGVANSDGFGFGINGSAFHGFIPDAGGFFNSGLSFSSTGVWAHVAMTRTNGIISFYLDGVRAPNSSTAPIRVPSDFTIGAQNAPGANGARFFSGAVDDVRIFNRALTSNEVAALVASTDGPCFPHAATAVATLVNGFVVGAEVTDGACGYTNVPLVRIIGGGGSNATATATISNGIVRAITITSAGCCYTNTPIIVIDSPPFPASVSIRVSRVAVLQHVMIGKQYVLEGSSDLLNWAEVAPPYVAQTETVETEVIAGQYQFFRTREIEP
jgi:hypothetical protein